MLNNNDQMKQISILQNQIMYKEIYTKHQKKS